MLYLIVGIVLGAAFHEFWHDLFFKARNLVSSWMSDKPKTEETGAQSSAEASSNTPTEPPNDQAKN